MMMNNCEVDDRASGEKEKKKEKHEFRPRRVVFDIENLSRSMTFTVNTTSVLSLIKLMLN